MKRQLLLLLFLFSFLSSYTQTGAKEFEAVIRSGNSEKAFTFIRNVFGVPEAKDPFLHFKPRGIQQLISFYDHFHVRIEATSLITYSQTKQFWTNYSNQFTAGKWNYRDLYKNDSLAWMAANYSVMMIYAHEIGHYMSYNLVNDYRDDYTCEEMVANECLAAFANNFTGNKILDMHRKLFLSLAKQTYSMIPDSNKTGFSLPMDTWCASNPMQDFFQYFEKDQLRFLRLYGYSQFRMMEAALNNYKDGTFANFLNKKFYDFYNTYTPASRYPSLKYKVISRKEYKNAREVLYFNQLSKRDSGNFFDPYFYNERKYHFDAAGQILQSYITDVRISSHDTVEKHNYSSFSLINLKFNDSGATVLENRMFEDSVSGYHSPGKTINTDYDMISAVQNDSNYYYLVRVNKNIFGGLDLQRSDTHYELVHLEIADNKYYISRKELPDSLYKNERMENQELLLVGANGPPILITNELTKGHEQLISIYPVSKDPLQVASAGWQNRMLRKGYFNMQDATLFWDGKSDMMTLCFWNPVTGSIYLNKFTAGKIQGYELYARSSLGKIGPRMEVAALRLVDNNTLYVFAQTREPGNNTKRKMEKLVLRW